MSALPTHRLLATGHLRRAQGQIPGRTRPAYSPPPALGARARPLIAKLYQAHAPGRAELLLHWPEIVGADLARHTEPGTLVPGRGVANNGQLTVTVAGGPAALEIQHQEPQILERINTFFGYRAVGRLKLVQGVLTPRTVPAAPREAQTEPDPAAAAPLTAKIQAPDLRAALTRLGACILASGARTR